jgi:hypothetical protein
VKDTLVILQCCKKKGNIELYPDEDFDLAIRVPKTKEILLRSVKDFSSRGIIDTSSKPIKALSRYEGHFYNTPGLRSKVAEEIRNGSNEFLIMSAGYGFVHPFQRIYDYEQKMKGNTTRYWLSAGLPRVLQEFLETGGHKKAYGFFSKSADYRKIFESVDWHRLTELQEAGYFYLDGIKGASKILKLSALLMLKLLDKNFEEKPQSFRGAEVVFVKLA